VFLASRGRDPMDSKGDGVAGLMEKSKLSENEKKGIKFGGQGR
jgi:hypothetical protein